MNSLRAGDHVLIFCFLKPDTEIDTDGSRYHLLGVFMQPCMNDGVAFEVASEFPSLEVFQTGSERTLLFRSYSSSHCFSLFYVMLLVSLLIYLKFLSSTIK